MFVIETINQVKFLQFQGSMLLATKVVLDQVAHEHEARGVKSLKIKALSRCKEGTVVYGPVKYPNGAGCNICNRNHQPNEISQNSRLNVAQYKDREGSRQTGWWMFRFFAAPAKLKKEENLCRF